MMSFDVCPRAGAKHGQLPGSQRFDSTRLDTPATGTRRIDAAYVATWHKVRFYELTLR
jgi:hypothetical protein